MNHADACDPAKAYFHAKANFNADKGDAKFFGFEKVKGYNAACLNYGDFVEIVTKRDQTLAALKTEILAKSLTEDSCPLSRQALGNMESQSCSTLC